MDMTYPELVRQLRRDLLAGADAASLVSKIDATLEKLHDPGNYLTDDLPIQAPRYYVLSWGVQGTTIEGWANDLLGAQGAWHAVVARYIEDGMFSFSDKHESFDKPILLDTAKPGENGEPHPLGHSEFGDRVVLLDLYKVTNTRPDSWMWRDDVAHAHQAIRELVGMLHEIDHDPSMPATYASTEPAIEAVRLATASQNYTDVFPWGTCDECGSAANEEGKCTSDDEHNTGIEVEPPCDHADGTHRDDRDIEYCNECDAIISIPVKQNGDES